LPHRTGMLRRGLCVGGKGVGGGGSVHKGQAGWAAGLATELTGAVGCRSDGSRMGICCRFWGCRGLQRCQSVDGARHCSRQDTQDAACGRDGFAINRNGEGRI